MWNAVYEMDVDAVFSVLMPACLVLGLAMIFFPGYREERIARGEETFRD